MPTEIILTSEFTDKCEVLLKQTQLEIQKYQNENHSLKTNILDLINENKHISFKLEKFKEKSPTLFKDSEDDATRERLTLESFKNIQKQIDTYKTENCELRLLQQTAEKTIDNLQKEIKTLRNELFQKDPNCENKIKFVNIIKSLENTVEHHKAEASYYFKQKQLLIKQLQSLKVELHDKEVKISELLKMSVKTNLLQSKLNESNQKYKDLDKYLKKTENSLHDCTEREKSALQKVHEALYIAERAVEEKRQAEKTVKLLKEESDSLASTIGKVMDEAAVKVDQDVKDLKKKYTEREQHLIEGQKKLSYELDRQKHLFADNEKVWTLNRKEHAEVKRENKKLIEELEITKKQLIDFKLKIEAHENFLSEDVRIESREKDYEERIKAYIQINKELKDKYKEAVTDLTLKFKAEIHHLQEENISLKAKYDLPKFSIN